MKDPKRHEQALLELLALTMSERRDTVALDVRRRSPRYRDVPAHDLAEALGVPDPWKPGSDWSFTQYAEIVKVEQYAGNHSPASELVYPIKDSVDAKRFELLLDLSAPLDDVEAPSYSFLLRTEREALEQAIAEQQLERNESNAGAHTGPYSRMLFGSRHGPAPPARRHSAPVRAADYQDGCQRNEEIA
jgi:hypothetical protein